MVFDLIGFLSDELRLRDRKCITSWIKIISLHKIWEIYMQYAYSAEDENT
jgi:hypothetical protein